MRSELEADLAEQIWALHLEAPLEVAEPERAEVLATALEYGATVYDAVYIALGHSLDLPLLTALAKPLDEEEVGERPGGSCRRSTARRG